MIVSTPILLLLWALFALLGVLTCIVYSFAYNRAKTCDRLETEVDELKKKAKEDSESRDYDSTLHHGMIETLTKERDAAREERTRLKCDNAVARGAVNRMVEIGTASVPDPGPEPGSDQ